MSIFKFRDSWEVWRKKVDIAIGNVERLDADEVLFNNSGTSMSATNVQAAIEESYNKAVDSSDVTFNNAETTMESTNVENAIKEAWGATQANSRVISKLNNSYIYKGYHDITVTSDGTLTYAEIFASLVTQFNTYLALMDDNVYAKIACLTGAYNMLTTMNKLYDNSDTLDSDFPMLYIGFNNNNLNQALGMALLNTNSSDCSWIVTDLGYNSQTFANNFTNTAVRTDLEFTLRVDIFEKNVEA